MNLAFRQGQFFPHLRVAVPPGGFNDRRSNEVRADIAFSKALFVEKYQARVALTIRNLSSAQKRRFKQMSGEAELLLYGLSCQRDS
jgi:hypothetical protein